MPQSHAAEMIEAAAMHNQSGAFDRALDLTQRTLQISTSLSLSEALGLLYQQMSAHLGLQNFEAALATFREAEMLMPEGDDVLFSPMLLLCGDLCDAAGETDTAIMMYERVLKVTREIPSDRVEGVEARSLLDFYIAQAMSGMGISSFTAGRKADAIAWLEKSIEAFTSSLGPDAPETVEAKKALDAVRRS